MLLHYRNTIAIMNMVIPHIAILFQLRTRQAGTSAVQFGDPVPVGTNEVTVIDTGETQMRQAEIGIPGTDGYSAMAWQRLDTSFIRVGWPLPN